MRIHRLVIFLIGFHIINSCRTSQEPISYKVSTYSIDGQRRLLFSDNLISYGNYLFEFKNLIHNNRTIQGQDDSTSTYIDTTGVYLLSAVNKLYYEFDTFALKNTVIKVGNLANKEFGFKFNFSSTTNSGVTYSALKPVVLNNINCFVSEIISDSILQEVFLVKDKNLNSLYKLNGVEFTDKDYCIVGFHIYDLKNKTSLLQDLEVMRPLTKGEKEICASMISKSKLCVVDTITPGIKQ